MLTVAEFLFCVPGPGIFKKKAAKQCAVSVRGWRQFGPTRRLPRSAPHSDRREASIFWSSTAVAAINLELRSWQSQPQLNVSSRQALPS